MSSAAASAKASRSRLYKFLHATSRGLLWLAVLLLCLWATAALYIDVRIPPLRVPLAIVFALAIATVLWKYKLRKRSALLCLLGVVAVLGWWLSLKPTNIANWQADVDRTASIEVHDDQVTIHNFRDCHYRTEFDYTDCWSDRTVNLSDLHHMDLFFTTWGAPGIGHPIVSFDFGHGQHVAFSIEARYKAGQTYSALLGFFRQYELIVIVSDESDVIRLRTNFRKDEEVFLYRLNLTPDAVRKIFGIYVNYLDGIKDHPEWYNALTRNCTTAIDSHISRDFPDQDPWSYRMVLNGTMDELLYSRGRLVTNGLPFSELKQRAHINAAARAAGNSPDYSELIRAGRPGFE